jgi:hypothetical protein
MSGTDPQDLIQWQETLRWLGKADQDVRAAPLLLDSMVEQAAFYAGTRIDPDGAAGRPVPGYPQDT